MKNDLIFDDVIAGNTKSSKKDQLFLCGVG